MDVQGPGNLVVTPAPQDEAGMLRAFFEDAPTFFAIKDSDGRYVFVNRFVTDSCQRHDLIGKTAYDL